jgi:hypothetical protein
MAHGRFEETLYHNWLILYIQRKVMTEGSSKAIYHSTVQKDNL